MTEEHHYTQGELQLWMRCRRKWWLTVYRRLQIKTVLPYGARQLGTHVHDALATWYELKQDPVAHFDNTYARLMAMLPPEQEYTAQNLARDHDLGRIMIEGYLEWVAAEGKDIGLEVVGVEQKIDVPLHPRARLLGKLDLRVRDEHNARWFLDHKTVGGFDGALRLLPLDFQMKMYHLLEYLQAVEEGLDPTSNVHCAGGMYNMLRKVKRTKTATPPFYVRETFRHNVHELRNFYVQVAGLVREIADVSASLDDGADPNLVVRPTPQPSCTWSCEWFDVCPMFDDGSAAEEYLRDAAIEHDPLERYNERTDEV